MSAEPPITLPHGREAQESKKARLQREALERACRVEDLKWVLDDVRGRRVIRYLMQLGGVFETCFHQNYGEMCRAEGRKEQGAKILALIEEHFPNHYLAIKRDERDERAERNRKRAADRNPNNRSAGE